MIDRISGKTISFGRSATTGAANLDSELRYYDYGKKKIGDFSPTISVDPSVEALVLLEKAGHVARISECHNEDTPNIIAIGGTASAPPEEAIVLTRVILKEYEAQTEKKLPVFTVYDLNGGGINGQEKFAEEGEIEYTPLITPEVVEKYKVVFVGATKEKTANKFQNSLSKMQRKFEDYGSPKAPVNIEELLTHDGASDVGKLIMDLVKAALESDIQDRV